MDHRDRPGKPSFVSIKFSTNNAILQPLKAFQHPAFKNMIDIASYAPNGVNLPATKTTHQAIISLFLTNLAALKEQLNVGSILFEL